MGERRKRKSTWDMEKETRHMYGITGRSSWIGNVPHRSHEGVRYHEFSDSRMPMSRKSGEQSGWPSWESIEEDPMSPMSGDFTNTRETMKIDHGKRYYRSMSPGFDDMDMHTYNRMHDADRSYLQRYPRRGKSRSRSRSRSRSFTGGRSPSRSLSRGRGRETEMGWSRGRSPSFENAKTYSRSRSPGGDYRHLSCGWTDKRNSTDKPSQICKEVTAGRCRKGSQCRFIHPGHRDGDLVQHDTVEAWRSRSDLTRGSEHSYRRSSGFESSDRFSDRYHREEEQFLNKNKSSVPCKGFARGNCRWGDNCRFSHHADPNDGFGQGARNASFDKYSERQSYNNEKPPCKFFAAGKCDRSNCRFSHEDPNFKNQESKLNQGAATGSSHDTNNRWNGPTWNDDTTRSFSHEDPKFKNQENKPNQGAATRSSHDTNNWWDGPTWDDDTTRSSDTRKTTGWDEAIVTNTTGVGDSTSNAQNDNKEIHSLEKEPKKWEILECTSISSNGNQQLSLIGKSGVDGRDISTTESTAEENTANKQEPPPLHGSWLQKQEGTGNVNVHDALQSQENRSDIKQLWKNVGPASHIQDPHSGTTEYNVVNSSGSGFLGTPNETGFPAHSTLFSRQSLNLYSGSTLSGYSSISNDSKQSQNVLPIQSNGFIADLNVPETPAVGHLNMEIQTQNNQNAVLSSGLLEANVPQLLSNLLTGELSAQVTNLLDRSVQQISPEVNPVFLPQRYENSQTNVTQEVSGSSRMVPPFSDDRTNLPKTTISQEKPGAITLNLFDTIENDEGNTEYGNHKLEQGTVQSKKLEHSCPLLITVIEIDDSDEKQPRSPTPRRPEVLPTTEVPGNDKVDEESKKVPENKQTEPLDDHQKVEAVSGNKDDKGMRIFKNSLIDFVKEILKPTWKEGQMTREVHKTVVKKVVDKVSSSLQVDHIPRTQDKVDQYLSHSKPKITKLVQAYVERCRKADS